jgi:hypothetical protein
MGIGVPRARAADYFPLQEGNQWTYSPSYGDKGNRIDTIVGSEVVNDTLTYIWNRQEAPDDNYNEKRWIAKDNSSVGFYKIWSNEGIDPAVTVNPPWSMIPLEPKVGDTWIQELTLGNLHVRSTFYVESIDDTVTVPAGTFTNCVRIRELNEITEGSSTEYEYEKHWYAPGIGPIWRVSRHRRHFLVALAVS